MKIFISCGGYYSNFDYPKALTEINGEALIDRTIRLLSHYDADVVVCCNPEENAFDKYNPLRANYTFDYLKQSGYYLDLFVAVPYDKPCIYLFGDVYYTEDAINKIVDKFNSTNRNIFICNAYPFNEQGLRQGEPFGWIVKDQKEFRCAVELCKKLQDRNVVDHANGVASNWELAHIINGLGINQFNLRKKDCLIIDDLTIDIDFPDMIEKIQGERKDV
jgi:GTP:adenosylcobinamide-phosphate guanylyltransferase